MIYSFLLVFLAGICNSAMDKMAFQHSRSIFAKMQGGSKLKDFFKNFFSDKWWKLKYAGSIQSAGRAKWSVLFRWRGRRYKLQYNIPVQVVDGWHFSKMLMVVFLCLAIILYRPVFGQIIDFVLLGIAFNLGFRLGFSFLFHTNKTLKS